MMEPADISDPVGTVAVDGGPRLERVAEALLSLADGRFGTQGTREEDGPGSVPLTLVAADHADMIALGWRRRLAPDRAAVVREVLARTPVILAAPFGVTAPRRGAGGPDVPSDTGHSAHDRMTRPREAGATERRIAARWKERSVRHHGKQRQWTAVEHTSVHRGAGILEMAVRIEHRRLDLAGGQAVAGLGVAAGRLEQGLRRQHHLEGLGLGQLGLQPDR
ncbi:MAG: hypothetical protein M3O65_01680 [Actinomycetota bacterium]|nr:hypothetical protein [Actinomycetota bacterium]